MYKIKVHSIISSTESEAIEINTNGIKDNNIIIYKEDKIEVTIKILNEKVVLERKDKDKEIKLEFIKDKTTKSYIKIYNPDSKLQIEVETKKIIIEKNNIYIEYKLNISEEIFIYNIFVEVATWI